MKTLVRPALVRSEYTLHSLGGWLSVNSVLSDLPSTVFYGADASPGASALWNDDNAGATQRITRTWYRFHNGPLVATQFSDLTKADLTTAVISGYPLGVYLGFGGSVGVRTADTFNVRLVTADFDPTTLCWSNQPAFAGFPIAATLSVDANYGNTNTGLFVPFNTPCYGFMAHQTTDPGGGSGPRSNSWGFGGQLLVQN